MMKQLKLSFLLTVLMSMVASVASAQAEIDGIYYDLDSEAKTASVASNPNNYSGDVTIPASVTNEGTTYNVTSIGGDAFYYCKNLTSVNIPSSVTTIGSGAFYYCSSLTSITIPSSVTTIGSVAFYYCSSLTSITIPSSVTNIGYHALSGCPALTSISVETGNTMYDSREDCNAIIEKNSKTLIAGCQNTIIPSSVTTIGSRAFEYCTSLTSITIPESVTNIGEYAFAWCYGLTSITIPEGVTTIGESAFAGCSDLTEPIYNSKLFAFLPASYQGEYSIPEGIETICGGAFDGCYDLTSITIPESVTTIEDGAFSSCYGLTKPIYNSKLFAFLPASYQGEYSIPEGIETIYDGAFRSRYGLTSITIPESVMSIGKWAFSGCSGLTSVIIPESVMSIGEYAFSGCSGLTSISIPESVTSIRASAFFNCSGLTEPIYNSKLFAFLPISYQGEYSIPEGIETICGGAFYGCSGLTSVTIPESVMSIGEGAFYGCSGLTSITIPASVTNIQYAAFYNCKNLTDVHCLAKNVPTTGDYHIFGDVSSATLHVPAGSTEAYKTTSPWSEFGTIVEIEEEKLDIEPMETDTEIAFDEAISDETDLSGVVVENMFITLDLESGDGYLQEEGCLVLSSTLTEEQVKVFQADGLNIWEVRNGFNGIILEVPAGTGTISVMMQTGEGRALSVKVGEDDVQSFVQVEKGTVTISYEVEAPQYVYIYGSKTAASSAKRRVQGSQEKTVRIYSVKWAAVDPSAIIAAAQGSDASARLFFTLDGKVTGAPQRGINIVRMSDGSVRKIMVK